MSILKGQVAAAATLLATLLYESLLLCHQGIFTVEPPGTVLLFSPHIFRNLLILTPPTQVRHLVRMAEFEVFLRSAAIP